MKRTIWPTRSTFLLSSKLTSTGKKSMPEMGMLLEKQTTKNSMKTKFSSRTVLHHFLGGNRYARTIDQHTQSTRQCFSPADTTLPSESLCTDCSTARD